MHIAIIVAGGSGSRMNSETPKQFLLLGGKPLLMYSIKAFHDESASTKIIVVLPKVEMERWKVLCRQYQFEIPHEIVSGGNTRFESVRKGLEYVSNFINDDPIIAVHDGVRPLISEELIKKCFAEASSHGIAVPCIKVTDSIRQISGEHNKHLNRRDIVLVQTPQCFRYKIIRKAYTQSYNETFADDATLVEVAGYAIHLVSGEKENIKITVPSDLKLAQSLI